MSDFHLRYVDASMLVRWCATDHNRDVICMRSQLGTRVNTCRSADAALVVAASGRDVSWQPRRWGKQDTYESSRPGI